MSTPAAIPADQLADLVNAETQRQAARMAQEIFAGVFRQSVSADGASDVSVLQTISERCRNWCQAGGSDEAQAARLALLISGLDQWGLAYTQAFKLQAIPALSTLLGALRTPLDTRADALFQRYFDQIERIEADAIDFKIELRRTIHLALWHAMAACETGEQAAGILQPLGSLMVALDSRMPELGWRLLVDALAHMQVALLTAEPPATPVAIEGTQQLMASLRHALPAERYQSIVAHSGQVVMGWQQSRQARAH